MLLSTPASAGPAMSPRSPAPPSGLGRLVGWTDRYAHAAWLGAALVCPGREVQLAAAAQVLPPPPRLFEVT